MNKKSGMFVELLQARYIFSKTYKMVLGQKFVFFDLDQK